MTFLDRLLESYARFAFRYLVLGIALGVWATLVFSIGGLFGISRNRLGALFIGIPVIAVIAYVLYLIARIVVYSIQVKFGKR